MKQKHFMDIEVLREENSELRSSNACGFKAGMITTRLLQQKIQRLIY